VTVAALIVLAGGFLTASVRIKEASVAGPAWLGTGLVGICLLLLAVALESVTRKR
jgi:multidrug transporter EmrE-like cation transporter